MLGKVPQHQIPQNAPVGFLQELLKQTQRCYTDLEEQVERLERRGRSKASQARGWREVRKRLREVEKRKDIGEK